MGRLSRDFFPELDFDPTTDYRALAAAKNEIRLLEILPSHDQSSIICCRLKHVSLNEPPAYEALSYCWGNAEDTETIKLNGSRFSATTNLVNALRQLRSQVGHDRLWVDALCINQKDLDERARQVEHMKYIYEEATAVIVWVGLEDDQSVKAQDFMEYLGREPSELEAFRKEQYQSAKSERFQSSWEACDGFFARPYWRRVWIIQEIAAAANVSVQCGKRVTSWDDVQRLLQFKTDLINFEKYRALVRNKARLGTLLEALFDTRHSLATDPKDKVYALLGLVSDGNQITGLPNYSQTVDVMLKKITKIILQREKNLNLIAIRRPDMAPSGVLPSWVPHLTDLAQSVLPWQADYFNRSKPVEDCNIEISADELCVRAKYCKTIARLTTTLSECFGISYLKPLEKPVLPSISERTLFNTIAIASDSTRLVAKTMLVATYPDSRLAHLYSKTDISKCLLALSWSKGQDLMKKNHPDWLNWLARNGDFSVGNRPLQTYFEPLGQSRSSKIGQAAREVGAGITIMYAAPIWLGKQLVSGKSEWETSDFLPLKDEIEKFWSAEQKQEVVDYLDCVINRFERILRLGFRLFTTTDGEIGMAPSDTKEDDMIYEIYGCARPIILRKCSDGWKVIGEAYICTSPRTSGNPEERLKLV
jgi:hypothetical protein